MPLQNTDMHHHHLPHPPSSSSAHSVFETSELHRRASTTGNTTSPLLHHRRTSVSLAGLPALQVECLVRTRIPSEFGGTCYLHLYANNHDNVEHMAIVYGEDIRSTTLDAIRNGDTDYDRMVRGARPMEGVNADKDDTRDAQPASHTLSTMGGSTGQASNHDDDDDDGAEYDIDSTGIPIQPPILSLRAPTAGSRQRRGTTATEAPLVRVHSCCFTGEVLGSLRCDCAEQLQESMKQMALEQRGVVLYLVQEGRGIGLREKLKAYNLIDQGHDTLTANVLLGHAADARTYHVAAAMLKDLGLATLRLLTNNPDKGAALARAGIVMAERIGMVPASWRRYRSLGALAPVLPVSAIQDRDGYLMTKVERMGHILDVPPQISSAVTAQRKAINVSMWTGG
ncbi:GTP cyclohydrolase II [Synchytrium endobioticum]|uniref:GTP cyclohydrolase II n=1 Tax=Synchytrium endobioticum TaxID=286115 RepID=A0A507DJ70_9FUNG|nr:GTP cyclohydrolase II [Synchytrium endobioticum]